MKNQILKKIYRAVVYLRLSDEDGDNRESDSISNQRILIHSFLKSHPEIQVVKECVDDGYTGTNFNRPGFQEMLRMLEEGEADCIIVKDLSRYGRDFSGVLQYVERILPKMGVRLILVNDNYDSLTPNRDFLTLRFKSLINDLYPADTSKSVRSHLYVKMTAGQCVAPFAFYGYLKSEEDKHKLVMDEVAASVVRDIYHMKMQGCSLTDISEELNRRGILTPLRYKQVYLKQKLKTGFRLTEKPVWMPTMVRRILLDERYTGVLIQGKTTTPNHKVKVVIHKEEAEWIRYENAFEPVINRHQYEVVGNLMNMDTMRGAKGLALLSGLVKCGDCKESMVLKSPDKVHHYYVCSTSLYEKQCSSHSISEKKLVGAVTEAILHYISVLVELKEILAYVKTASIPRQRLLEEDKKLEMLEKESQRILNIKVKLYDSFAEEILDRTEFETFKAKYDQSLEEIRQAMECQQREIRNLQETLEKQQEWKDTLDNWAANPKEKQGADGPFKGRIFCGHCGKRLGRSRSGGNEKHKYMVYKCPSFSLTDHTECFRTVNEIYINQAVKAALRYQIQLAVESKKTYGAEFYQKLEQEVAEKIKNARQKYEKYGRKLETLFEHYATGLLDCKEYQEIKSIYQEEQQAARQNMKQIQLRGQHLLDQVKARMDWTEELLKYQRFQKIEKGIADRFIEKITVYSKDYVEIVFWFGDLFEKELEKELDNMEGGLPYAV